jgi:hypothetical protein
MTAKTAGQLAYEAMHASREKRGHEGGHIAWEQLDEFMAGDFAALKREDLEAAAAAVETEQLRLVREDRDARTRRMLDVAANLEQSAAATHPSAKSRAETAAAAKIRKGAGE